jgi:hypothetical protein
MAAMVESDPAPSLLEPTTKVGDDTAVPSTEASIANASHAISKENQDLDLVDTRLLMTDGAASLPQVTKLPTEHLVVCGPLYFPRVRYAHVLNGCQGYRRERCFGC